MAAIGLFTLNTSKLNEGILGGLGTGFAEGSTASTGAASGVAGFAGSATGSTQSTGAAAGSPDLSGSGTGSTNSAGQVSGSVGFAGSATGASVSNGSATGSPQLSGVLLGDTQSSSTATGFPDLAGIVVGVTSSTGQATGSPDVPPTPPVPLTPEPEPVTGHSPRVFYPVRPARPKRPPQPRTATGSVRGDSVTTYKVRGSQGLSGLVVSVSVSQGNCTGIRWPDGAEIQRRICRKQDNDLILLEL